MENFIKQVEDKTVTDFLPKVRNTKDLQIMKSVQSHLLKATAVMDAANAPSVSNNPLPLDVTTATEPVTKNFIKQDRLYSSMRKRKLSDGRVLRKPSMMIKQEVGDILAKAQTSSSVIFPIVSNGEIKNEHNYFK